MTTFNDLKNFFASQNMKLIIAADGEPRVSVRKKDGVVSEVPAGGVAVALDPIAKATNALYVARAKHAEEKAGLDKHGKMAVVDGEWKYTLKRLFITDKDMDDYYFGFSNQTFWPLCHVAFEEPRFSDEWYKGYKKVNQQFANAIKEEIKGKTFLWIHDYQLALVPLYLNRPKDTITAMFWHIPWPTWEVFRILPNKKEILQSMLSCDFLAFHRGYQARNFLQTVERELEARIDLETSKVYYNKKVTKVTNLPLGIDTDVVKSLVHKEERETLLGRAIREVLGFEEVKDKVHPLNWYFEKYKVIFGVDRLDYTKGLIHRLKAIDRFFEKNPQYIGKVVYLGIIAPSREVIPSYKLVKKQVRELEDLINNKYGKRDWKPVHLIHELFSREDILNFYHRADVCVVTPLDDGMNLVSKEFVIASSLSSDPGMLVLSQFAGSATDLSDSLIVNPYNIEEVAVAMKQGLDMSKQEKINRNRKMAEMLEEKNVYEWAEDYLKAAIQSVR